MQTNKFKDFVIHQVLSNSRMITAVMLLLTAIFAYGIRYIFLDDNIMNFLPKDIESRLIWDEIKEDFGETDFMFVAIGNTLCNVH